MLTRLKEHENSSLYSKMRVYDGESLKDTDPHAKTIQEYRDAAGVTEGMDGVSTRFAYKILSETFNFDTHEVAADPGAPAVRARAGDPARAVARRRPRSASSSSSRRSCRRATPSSSATRSRRPISRSYNDFGQNLFDRYVAYADAWIEDHDFKDPDTGQLMSRQLLEQELSKIEKPAGIANPKDFRYEVVKFSLARARQERRQEPELDQLREDPRGHRAAHVQPGRGPAAGDQLRQEAGQRDREEARGVRAAHGRARLHAAPGPPPGRMVHAGEARPS